MRRYRTRGIILRRVDYGEADRILTFLTPHGKISVLAKGVRKPGSKLSGGIELLSESDLSLVEGRGNLATLTSSRLHRHYGQILNDYERLTLAYETLAAVHRNTQDDTDELHYELLRETLTALDDSRVPLSLAAGWFYLNLLTLLGHRPNLSHDTAGRRLEAGQTYRFIAADAAWQAEADGPHQADHIKFWRLLQRSQPAQLLRIQGIKPISDESLGAIKEFFDYYSNG